MRLEFKLNTITVKKQKQKQKKPSGALVAHTCNPSYSGGRDQEAQMLKPAQANSS
jgi:hypothetical protein